MSIRNISIDDLLVNRANDRHGELENETAAIAWLFHHRELHMKNLAKDIVAETDVYEQPLVWFDGAKYLVFDGNRRVTCLKLLQKPNRAPSASLQKFYSDLRSQWSGQFPEKIQCQVETDRDRIDRILFRRHTGTQNGVGQSTWDDRMKDTFVQRTGKGAGLNVADEVEKLLAHHSRLPKKRKIPRSTLNRLLSAETFRNRVGISVVRGKFTLTHNDEVVVEALARVAEDLTSRRIVLGDLWDIEGKRSYLDGLDREGQLPGAADLRDAGGKAQGIDAKAKKAISKRAAKPKQRTTLIPQVEYGVAWVGRIHRQKAIWEELQFQLDLTVHPNAISVLFRVLLELSVENYISRMQLSTINPGDKLAQRIVKVGTDLEKRGEIDSKYLSFLRKLPQQDNLFSTDTLNRYVHSSHFAPSPEHLKAMWDSIADFIVLCLNS